MNDEQPDAKTLGADHLARSHGLCRNCQKALKQTLAFLPYELVHAMVNKPAGG